MISNLHITEYLKHIYNVDYVKVTYQGKSSITFNNEPMYDFHFLINSKFGGITISESQLEPFILKLIQRREDKIDEILK